jgi:2-oxoglutarate dehydrogenase E1 component
MEDVEAPKKPKRIVLCSGKVYWDLYNHRKDNGIDDTVILRVEQLYPLNCDRLKELADKHSDASSIVWCQEEPQNMGAWTFIAPRLETIFGKKPAYAGRSSSASTAVGSLALHKYEQSELISQAFSL